MKKILFMAFAGGLSFGSVAQQDIHFSQFYASPLFLNPGAAGAFDGDLRTSLTYRNQWMTVTSPYNTIGLNADMKVFRPKGGDDYLAVGLTYSNDWAGDSRMTTHHPALAVAYNVNLSPGQFLSAGPYIGLLQRSITTANLSWDSQWDGFAFDQTLPNGEIGINESFATLDLGVGLNYRFLNDNGVRFNMGVAAHHLNTPDINFLGLEEKLKLKFIAYASGEIPVSNTNTSFLPAAMYMMQGPNMLINLGTDYKIIVREGSRTMRFNDEISVAAGLYYRFFDAMFFTLRFNYAGFSVGAVYDLTLSSLSPATKGLGGFEAFLSYRMAFGRGSGVSSFR